MSLHLILNLISIDEKNESKWLHKGLDGVAVSEDLPTH